MTAVPSDGGPLVYVEDLAAPRLSSGDHHHLARVRRVRAGDPLIVGDARGRWSHAVFSEDTPELVGAVEVVAAPEPALTVAFALVKGSRPELVVQKLTELGIDQIVPFTAARSVVRWDEAKSAAAHERLSKVAREAAMQSRQARVPVVEPPATYAAVAGREGAVRADRGGRSIGARDLVILVGPEGGWSDEERDVVVPTVGLAEGVLRAETAAIVAGALAAAQRSSRP